MHKQLQQRSLVRGGESHRIVLNHRGAKSWEISLASLLGHVQTAATKKLGTYKCTTTLWNEMLRRASHAAGFCDASSDVVGHWRQVQRSSIGGVWARWPHHLTQTPSRQPLGEKGVEGSMHLVCAGSTRLSSGVFSWIVIFLRRVCLVGLWFLKKVAVSCGSVVPFS